MADLLGFRQKGTAIARGFQSQAADADPSEESGFAANIGMPVWKQFVANESFQKTQKGAIDAEQNYQRQVASENRSSGGGAWKGENGKVSRLNRGIPEEYDAESLIDHPELGGIARKSIWDRDVNLAKAEGEETAFRLKDPSFHARGLSKTDREAIEAEGSMLDEKDPRHIELKARLVADTEYQEEKKSLAQRSHDAQARARQIESTDPDSWLAQRNQPTVAEQRAQTVAAAQAQRGEVDMVEESAARRDAELQAKLAAGLTGPEAVAAQAERKEIAAARGLAAQKRVEAEAPIKAVQEEAKGDMMRGLETSVRQIPQLAYGVAALVGDTAEKITGFGEDLKAWGLEKYKASSKGMEPLSKDTDSFSTSWGKATKEGDVGALVDFVQYGLGYFAGQAIESLAVAGIGGAVGAASTGPAAPAGAVGGAATGLVAKTAVKATAKGLIEKLIEKQALLMATKEAAKITAKQGVKVTAETIAKRAGTQQLRKQAAKDIGSGAALIMNGALMELGSIYPEAVEQAASEGREMTRADVARVWMSGIVAGGIEGVTDKIGIDLLKGKFSDVIAKTGVNGRLGSAVVGGVADAGVEGVTEAVQTGIERFGARQSLADAEAGKQYIDAAALGAVGGGAMGGLGGAINGGKPKDPVEEKNDIDTALQAIDPEAPAPTGDEVIRATGYTSPAMGVEGVADGVLVERELALATNDDDAAHAAAKEAIQIDLDAAIANGAKESTIKQLRENLANAQPANRAHLTRAVLKIAAGMPMANLTTDEVKALGYKGDGGTITAMTPDERKAAGVSAEMLVPGHNNAPILTDAALAQVAAASPRARARITMDETQARAKALATPTPAAPAPGAPQFEVTMKSGKKITVAATNEAEARTAAAGHPDTDYMDPVVSAVAIQSNENTNPLPTTNTPQGPPPVKPSSQVEGLALLPEGGLGQESGSPQLGVPAQAPTPATGPALTHAKARIAELKANSPQLASAIVDDGKRSSTNWEKIEINADLIIKEALESGMSDQDALLRFDFVLDEEITHFAQYRSAWNIFKEQGRPGGDANFLAWFNEHYGNTIWQGEFGGDNGTKGKIVRGLYTGTTEAARAEWDAMNAAGKAKAASNVKRYGSLPTWDAMPNTDKALEGIRVMKQRHSGKSATEAARLWTDISQTLYHELKVLLVELKRLVRKGNLSPALQQEIEHLDAALKQFAPRNPKTTPQKPASSKKGDGVGKPPGEGGDSSTPGNGGVVPTGRDGAGASLVEGQQVVVTKDGVRYEGIVSSYNGVVVNPNNGGFNLIIEGRPKKAFFLDQVTIEFIATPEAAVTPEVEADEVATPPTAPATQSWSAENQKAVKKLKIGVAKAQRAEDWAKVVSLIDQAEKDFNETNGFPDQWQDYERYRDDAQQNIRRTPLVESITKPLTPATPEAETSPPPAAPELTPDEQAAKDFFNELGEGLDSAPLQPEDFYRSKGIPKEKRVQFMSIADGFYDAGARTPQDIAAKLEKIGGSKLRAYSAAVWSALKTSYPELPDFSAWAGVYAEMDASTEVDEASTNQDAEINVGDWVRFKGRPDEGPWSVWFKDGDRVKLDNSTRNLSFNIIGVEKADAPQADAASMGDQSMQLAEAIAERIKRKEKTSIQQLTDLATGIFGGRTGDGFDIKTAYDAVEMAINLLIMDSGMKVNVDAEQARQNLATIREWMEYIPTQTRRTGEMDALQQFSTPPHFSYIASWVAAVTSRDVGLEPSSGLGGLAAWMQQAGADVLLNELSPRRREMLDTMHIGRPATGHDAGLLHALMLPGINKGTIPQPTVVVMNPPFSNNAAGRKDLLTGGKHIEEALKLLPPGGRLVAIVGEGMALDAPRYRPWWDSIRAKYNVRANIHVDGREYTKYGTTFSNRILVIDKTAPTGESVVGGEVKTIEDLIPLLDQVRTSRPQANDNSATNNPSDQQGGNAANEEGGNGSTPGNPANPEPSVGNPDPNGAGGKPDGTPVGGSGTRGGRRGGRGGRSGNTTGNSNDAAPGSGSGSIDENQGPVSSEVEQDTSDQEEREIDSAQVFSSYKPTKFRIKGSQPHPSNLVESSAMAATSLPDITITLNLPKETIESGELSDAQLEVIAAATQAHDTVFEDGTRQGFFVGDGTGVGKGREIAGTILHNWREGRKKAVWISEKKTLAKEAKRDFDGIGGKDIPIHDMSVKTAAPKGNGVAFMPYTGLKSSWMGLATDGTLQTKTGTQARIQSLLDWLGKDFDGVIALDEVHNAGNVLSIKKSRGMTNPSQVALRVVDLQKVFPKARILYVSATGATEPNNLAFAERLGLWGVGKAFSSATEFYNAIKSAGLSAMEIVARDLKALGLYVARTLSFDGVKFERNEHLLTEEQEEMYDKAAGAWGKVFQNLDEALQATGQAGSSQARSSAMAQFWGSQQRFFNGLLTALQMPTALADMKTRLDGGGSVVIQLVNTNEAPMERVLTRAFAENSENPDLDQIDFSSRQDLLDYVHSSFPVQQFHEVPDGERADGTPKTRWVPLMTTDENGQTVPVMNPAAVAMRDSLLEDLATLPLPDPPLEQILDTFGSEMVAEITGRKRRVVRGKDENGNERRMLESNRNDSTLAVEKDQFLEGKRRILVFSNKGGTGVSYHAGKNFKNQQKRFQYVVQAGWRADQAIQGLGRTHRADQVIPPHYILVSTNVDGHKRFISTIARRLQQLGALTSGERKTTGEGLFNDDDNLEDAYGELAVRRFFFDMFRDQIEGVNFADVTERMGYTKTDPDGNADNKLVDDGGNLNQEAIPPMNQFLNRLLALPIKLQNSVFQAFMERRERFIERAKENDTYDGGVETFKADAAKIDAEDVVYEDPNSSSSTKLIEVGYRQYFSFNELDMIRQIGGEGTKVVQARGGHQKLHALTDAGTMTESTTGRVLPAWKNWTIRGTSRSAQESINVGPRPGYAKVGDQFTLAGSTWQIAEIDTENGKAKVKRSDFDPVVAQAYHLEALYNQTGTVLQGVNENAQYLPNYYELTPTEAEAKWQEELDSAERFEEKSATFIVGTTLPIWHRIPFEQKRVKRVNLANGENFLGILVPEAFIDRTRSQLGAAASGITPTKVIDAVINRGAQVELSNGWMVKRTLSAGEQRIEVTGPESSQWQGSWEDSFGGFVERIQFRPRFFMPRDAGAIDRLLRYAPGMRMLEGGGTPLHSAPLRADSPEWKAMSKGERKEALQSAKQNSEISDGQREGEDIDSPARVLAESYEPIPTADLPEWKLKAVVTADREAGGIGRVQAVWHKGSARVSEAAGFGGALLRVFKKRVLLVATTTGEPLPFDGLLDKDQTNTIIIDVESYGGWSFLLGHELGHSIQHQRPDLYEKLSKAIFELAPEWSEYNARLAKIKGYDTQDKRNAEFVNDFIGSQFGEPKFWRKLYSSNRPVFRQLVDFALKYLKAIGGKISEVNRDVRPYFKDIEAARAVLAKTLEAYQRGEMPDESVVKQELVANDDGSLVSPLDSKSGGLQSATLPKKANSFPLGVPRDFAEEARDHQQASGKNLTHERAGFGSEANREQLDVVTAYYDTINAIQTNANNLKEARRMLASNPKDIDAKLKSAATDKTFQFTPADHVAMQLRINQLTEQAGDNKELQAENGARMLAYRIMRGDVARVLQIGWDRDLKPAERALAALTEAIYMPSKKIQKTIASLPLSERKAAIKKASESRLAAVSAELAKINLKLSDITKENDKLKLANSKLMKEVQKARPKIQQNVLKMIQQGASLEDIKRRLGVSAEEAQKINSEAREELRAKIAPMVAAGMSMEEIVKKLNSLQSAPLGAGKQLTQEQIAAEVERILTIGFGLPEEIRAKNIKKAKVAKVKPVNVMEADWSRPKFEDNMNDFTFDTKDRAHIMQRVEIIRGLAGAIGKIGSLDKGKQVQAMAAVAEINTILAKYGTDTEQIFQSSDSVESYGFDINDINHVGAVARMISTMDADIVDKGVELIYANMLSGLQTMLVNATAIIPATWEVTVGRAYDLAVNAIVKDPMSAQLGEARYILKGIKPAWLRAMSNFKAAFISQHPMFDRDVLAHEIDWDKILGGGGYRINGSISGKKGDIIRMPMRLLAATDDFNRTLMACVEVGTFAFRIAKARGMKPGTPEFDAFIKSEVNQAGSPSYLLAAQKASRAIFSNPLPSQQDPTTGKKIEVKDLGDVVGYAAASLNKFAAQEHDNLFAKAALAAVRVSFFPFQRTPFNILRKGVRHTLNPFSLFDILLGTYQNSRVETEKVFVDGKFNKDAFKRNANGRNPELIERLGQQLQGATLMLILAAMTAGEGDEDDQDKKFIITGSSPFTPRGRAERETQMRSGVGPYRISFRKDGKERFGISYGRFEPTATTLAATIDLMKSAKRSWRSGGDNSQAAAAALGGFTAQAQDKSFMKGISDLIALGTNILAEPDVKDNRKFQQFLASRFSMVFPNLIKQPIREMDENFRERSDSFMQEVLYQIAPAGQKPAKLDPYGQEVKKTGNAAGRIIDMTEMGTDKVNPVDSMLLRFRDKHPDKAWFPASVTNAEFKNIRTGKDEKMTGPQLAEFREMAGKRTTALLKSQHINYDNPTEIDVKKVKSAYETAKEQTKKALKYKFSKTSTP